MRELLKNIAKGESFVYTWKVESGKWKVESGKWKVESGKWTGVTGFCDL